jgi:hypothetical protein
VAFNWHAVVVQALIEIQEIDLVHFLFALDFEFCKGTAFKYAIDFTANRKKRVAFFRKRTRSEFQSQGAYLINDGVHPIAIFTAIVQLPAGSSIISV